MADRNILINLNSETEYFSKKMLCKNNIKWISVLEKCIREYEISIMGYVLKK